MLDAIRKQLTQLALTDDENSRVDRAMGQLNSAGFDPWGVDPESIKATLSVVKRIYREYFRVEVNGIERVPAGRVLLIANHSGQIPLDGMLIATSMVLDANPPRLVRGMVERWVPAVPFVSALFVRSGQVVGDHRNCRELLEKDQAVLVFPEGVGGSGKTIFKRYELQKFGTGFVRLALETRTPIVPVAVVGCEETYPSIYGWEPLAHRLGIPYIPMTPFFPLLGLLGALPLPTKVTLRFAPPIRLEADPDSPDADVERMVNDVKGALRSELQIGLAKRGHRLFTGSAK